MNPTDPQQQIPTPIDNSTIGNNNPLNSVPQPTPINQPEIQSTPSSII